MSNQKTNCGYLSPMLLALVVITFGFFNFSGYIISTVQVIPTQIELTLEQRKLSNEHRLCLSGAYSQPLVKNAKSYSSPAAFNGKFLISYNNFIFVKHQSLSKKLNIINPVFHFIQLKRIPQNSDDPSNINHWS